MREAQSDTAYQLHRGILYNTKYVSEMRVCDIPYVIVFSNGEPDRSKLFADRWDVHRLHGQFGATMAAVPLKEMRTIWA